jgi:hypothetical protein
MARAQICVPALPQTYKESLCTLSLTRVSSFHCVRHTWYKRRFTICLYSLLQMIVTVAAPPRSEIKCRRVSVCLQFSSLPFYLVLSVRGLCVHTAKASGFHTKTSTFAVGKAVMASNISCSCQPLFRQTLCFSVASPPQLARDCSVLN